MITIFYFIALTFSALSNIVLYIYYKITEDKYSFDFLIINLIFLFFVISLFPLQNINNELYTPLSIFSFSPETISTAFLIILFYEFMFKKRVAGKYKYLIPLAIIIFSINVFDILFLKESMILSNILAEIMNAVFFIEMLVIFIFFINRIEDYIKKQVMKLIIILLIYMPLEAILEYTYKTSSEIISQAIFSGVLCYYFINKVIKRIEEYKAIAERDSNDIYDSFKEKFIKYGITKREQEIVKLILTGKSNQNIADELFISINTVKIHIYNIYKKFDIKKRADLFNL